MGRKKPLGVSNLGVKQGKGGGHHYGTCSRLVRQFKMSDVTLAHGVCCASNRKSHACEHIIMEKKIKKTKQRALIIVIDDDFLLHRQSKNTIYVFRVRGMR